jgi:hypothetical protein
MEPTAEELVAAMHQAVQETPSLKSRFNASVEFRFDDVKERVDVSKASKSRRIWSSRQVCQSSINYSTKN